MKKTVTLLVVLTAAIGLRTTPLSAADEPPRTSYLPVVPKEPFQKTMERMSAEKPKVMQRQKDLLAARYDLKDDPPPASICPAASRCSVACESG